MNVHAQALQGFPGSLGVQYQPHTEKRQDADPVKECLLTCPGSCLIALFTFNWLRLVSRAVFLDPR